jgi:hypothetical protein
MKPAASSSAAHFVSTYFCGMNNVPGRPKGSRCQGSELLLSSIPRCAFVVGFRFGCQRTLDQVVSARPKPCRTKGHRLHSPTVLLPPVATDDTRRTSPIRRTFAPVDTAGQLQQPALSSRSILLKIRIKSRPEEEEEKELGRRGSIGVGCGGGRRVDRGRHLTE